MMRSCVAVGWIVAVVAVFAARILLERWPALSAGTAPAASGLAPEAALAAVPAVDAPDEAHRSGLPLPAPPKVL